MSQFPAGVSAHVSAPTTYQMQYVNGTNSYTEQFVVIQFGPAYVAAAGASLAGAVHSVALSLQAVPVLGQALGALVELAAAWYGAQSLESDGSVKLELAYHYAGTKAGGVDLTAWPVPGVDYRLWQGMVNGLINGIQHMAAPVRQGLQPGETGEAEVTAARMGGAALGRPAETDDVVSLTEIERAADAMSADAVQPQIEVLRGLSSQDDTQRQVLALLSRG